MDKRGHYLSDKDKDKDSAPGIVQGLEMQVMQLQVGHQEEMDNAAIPAMPCAALSSRTLSPTAGVW